MDCLQKSATRVLVIAGLMWAQVIAESLQTSSHATLGKILVAPQLGSCLGPEETCCYCLDPMTGGGYQCVEGNTCDDGAMFPACQEAPGKCGSNTAGSRSFDVTRENITMLSAIDTITVYLTDASNTNSVTVHQIVQVTLAPDHQALFISRANDNLLFTDTSMSVNGYRFLLNNITYDESSTALMWPKHVKWGVTASCSPLGCGGSISAHN